MSTVLTTDHPAWEETTHGTRVRAVRSGTGLWLASWGPDELELHCIEGTEDDKPRIITTDPSTLPTSVPEELSAGLKKLGLTRRLANPWLWDAITTAILRQVVRAGQARRLYRAWCQAYGTTLTTAHGPLAVAPDAQQVLDLDDDAFASIGAKFHRTALQAAARAYRQHEDTWVRPAPADLVSALISVTRIGPWTASAAAADFTGDFTVYPHADLAVRTWAAQVARAYAWPDTEKAFNPHWRHLAGPGDRHLHTLTLTTLTWGAHARTAEHTGTRP
ncbi:hypothetical protein J7E87_23805 [Streptomyces sp. ISL-1]|uniref:hypothetical protein n=1 Tax=Streptomyces sp. ISL-1 TaxID=2817657 RepID=UPI001BECADA8|nr:hypothetical protein [Streptomyces sp. ISL-1]MBT2392364.1 hypothetical protein [Streptomyces sp. ISL-1]